LEDPVDNTFEDSHGKQNIRYSFTEKKEGFGFFISLSKIHSNKLSATDIFEFFKDVRTPSSSSVPLKLPPRKQNDHFSLLHLLCSQSQKNQLICTLINFSPL